MRQQEPSLGLEGLWAVCLLSLALALALTLALLLTLALALVALSLLLLFALALLLLALLLLWKVACHRAHASSSHPRPSARQPSHLSMK